MEQAWINALIGGGIIGIAVSVMLVFNGRVTGISGLISQTLNGSKAEFSRSFSFVLGLLIGGFVLTAMNPTLFLNTTTPSTTKLILAGFLVGFGSLLGSGCTSGHGVCGISRFSPRSILATMTFISAGILIVGVLS